MRMKILNICKLDKKKNIYLCLMITGLLSSCGNNRQTPNVTIKYETKILSHEQRTLSTVYSASIQGMQDIDIYPQVAGTITQVRRGDLRLQLQPF